MASASLDATHQAALKEAKAALMEAVQRGDLQAVKQHLALPVVRENVAFWNNQMRVQRLGGPPLPCRGRPPYWFLVADGKDVFTAGIIPGGHVDIFRWFFSREQVALMGETLRRLALSFVSACFAPLSATSGEMAEVVFESSLFQEIMDDKERVWCLQAGMDEAARLGYDQWIGVLVAYGADPNHKHNYQTALTAMTRDGDTTALGSLVSHGAWMDDGELLSTVTNNAPQHAVSDWLRHGADPRGASSKHGSVLHYVASQYAIENVRSLIGEGCVDVDARDHDGATPLMRVAQNRYGTLSRKLEAMHLLIDAGADLNAVDQAQCSVVHYAVRGWAPECVQLVLERGADPNQRDGDGATPVLALVMHAKQYFGWVRVKSLLDVLLYGGADPFLCDHNGMSTVALLQTTENGLAYVAENAAFF